MTRALLEGLGLVAVVLLALFGLAVLVGAWLGR